MSKVAVVTGAGSGVGQAVALQMAREGWSVGLIGRRLEALQQTMDRAGEGRARMLPVSCDVASSEDVTRMAAAVTQKFGPPQVLVHAAGINIPRRALEVLSAADFRQVIDVNLTG